MNMVIGKLSFNSQLVYIMSLLRQLDSGPHLGMTSAHRNDGYFCLTVIMSALLEHNKR